MTDMNNTFEARLRAYTEQVETCLAALCPTAGVTAQYAILPEAQRYSLMAGGKRIRPVLTLAFCEQRCVQGLCHDGQLS